MLGSALVPPLQCLCCRTTHAGLKYSSSPLPPHHTCQQICSSSVLRMTKERDAQNSGETGTLTASSGIASACFACLWQVFKLEQDRQGIFSHMVVVPMGPRTLMLVFHRGNKAALVGSSISISFELSNLSKDKAAQDYLPYFFWCPVVIRCNKGPSSNMTVLTICRHSILIKQRRRDGSKQRSKDQSRFLTAFVMSQVLSGCGPTAVVVPASAL